VFSLVLQQSRRIVDIPGKPEFVGATPLRDFRYGSLIVKTDTRPMPEWLKEALQGEVTDNVPNKRGEPRRVLSCLAAVIAANQPEARPTTVRIYNIGSGGVGFTARSAFSPGVTLRLVPEGTPKEQVAKMSVVVRVIHCTQTIQGFKVGCAIES
jgi:hypothetical protein